MPLLFTKYVILVRIVVVACGYLIYRVTDVNPQLRALFAEIKFLSFNGKDMEPVINNVTLL